MNPRYDAARVHLGMRLRDALTALDRGHLEVALVTDDTGVLLGTVSDADVRRALLAGHSLDAPLAPHMQSDVTTVGPHVDRAHVLDLLAARSLAQVPIVDARGRLVGVHLQTDVVGTRTRPNCAVIMAGGKGTRLLPLTETVPKPMLRVAGRPILERLVLHLVGFGVRRIVLSVNYLSDVIERHFGDGDRFGCTITYLRETKPLGTGGALSLLPEAPTAPLLVLNGDLVSQFDVGRMLEFHEAGQYAATVGLAEHSHTVPFGVVDLDGSRVRAVREKPTVTWRTNAGIYVLEPRVVARVPSDVEYAMPSLIEDCIRRDEPVGGCAVEGDWIDIGQAHELTRACGDVPR